MMGLDVYMATKPEINEASSEDLKHKQKQSIKQAIPVFMYASMEYTYSHLENY